MNLNSLIKNMEDDIIKATQEIVAIRSVEEPSLIGKPFGEGVNRCLEYALDLAKKLGFNTKNLDGYAGYAEYGQGKETLGILVHLDIVPEGEGWSYPPYGGEIHNGRIYGRGTIDNKGPAIAALYALKAVKESQVFFNRKVRIIFGTNEETNWGCMAYYLEKEATPELAFVPDAEYPLINGEKGVTNVTFKFNWTDEGNNNLLKIKKIVGGIRSNMVPEYCEAYLEASSGELSRVEDRLNEFKKDTQYKIEYEERDNFIVIKSYGISAHGSLPEKGKNAISQLFYFLKLLELGESAGEKLVSFYMDHIGMNYNGELMGIDFSDDVSGKLTFNVGVINFEEHEGEIVSNIRIPIKCSIDDVLKRIEQKVAGSGVSVVIGKAMKAYYIPEDDFLVQKLLQVYQEKTGEYTAKPKTIGGATYARTLPKAVPFGPLFPGRPEIAHQTDEYIEIEDLIKNTEIYAEAIYQLTRI